LSWTDFPDTRADKHFPVFDGSPVAQFGCRTAFAFPNMHQFILESQPMDIPDIQNCSGTSFPEKTLKETWSNEYQEEVYQPFIKAVSLDSNSRLKILVPNDEHSSTAALHYKVTMFTKKISFDVVSLHFWPDR
jgi:hypothetical protein